MGYLRRDGAILPRLAARVKHRSGLQSVWVIASSIKPRVGAFQEGRAGAR